MKKIFLEIFFVTLILFGGFYELGAQRVHPQYLDGALYVEFKKECLMPKIQNLAYTNKIAASTLPFAKVNVQKAGIYPQAMPMSLNFSNVLDGVFSLRLENPEKIDEIIADLLKDPNVVNVEKVPLAFLHANGIKTEATNDTFYNTVKGINLKWHLDMVNAEQAWSLQKGQPHIKVAVIDNAIWGEHEDLQIPLKNQYNTSSPEVSSSPLASLNLDQDMECVKDAPCVVYDWSHGTHCAGIVGAISNNKTGIASLGGGITVLAISAPNLMSSVLGDAFASMRWAANNGAKVLSCSWGMYSSSSYGRNMVQEMLDNGITIVASAGNERSNSQFIYPAAYPGVITVGSCDANKNRSAFSNYGNWVDVMAPGGFGLDENEAILSTTFCKNQNLRMAGVKEFAGVYYDNMTGTSMAAPLVASLCGLLLSKDSTITPPEMMELLTSTAQKGGNLGIMTTSGIIDAYAALQAVSTRPKRNAPNFIKYLTGVCEKTYPELFWELESTESKPDFLRLYRNGLLILDNIVPEISGGSFVDSAASMATLHRYEICGVFNGVESYRKEVYLNVGIFYEVKAQAAPLNGGTVSGAGRYENNAMASLSASPNKGYTFVEWQWLDKWSNESWRFDSSINLRITREYLGIKAIFKQEVKIENIDDANILNLYPNPVSDILYFEIGAQEVIKEISIYELNGRKLKYYIQPKERSIFIGSLKQGVYIFQMITDRGSYTKKIVKK